MKAYNLPENGVSLLDRHVTRNGHLVSHFSYLLSWQLLGYTNDGFLESSHQIFVFHFRCAGSAKARSVGHCFSFLKPLRNVCTWISTYHTLLSRMNKILYQIFYGSPHEHAALFGFLLCDPTNRSLDITYLWCRFFPVLQAPMELDFGLGYWSFTIRSSRKIALHDPIVIPTFLTAIRRPFIIIIFTFFTSLLFVDALEGPGHSSSSTFPQSSWKDLYLPLINFILDIADSSKATFNTYKTLLHLIPFL